MWQDFAEYILNEVGDEDVRIAEVAVGKFNMIAEALSSRKNIIMCTTPFSSYTITNQSLINIKT